MNYLICCLLLFSKDSCREKFLNEILKAKPDKQYFLVIKAEKDLKPMKIVLTNIELEQNLKAKKSLNPEEVKKKIKNNQSLLIIDSNTHWFGTVKYYDEVKIAQRKGKNYFIKHYFDELGFLKDNVPSDYLTHIIEVLFNWNVLLEEGESNICIIDKNKFCN